MTLTLSGDVADRIKVLKDGQIFPGTSDRSEVSDDSEVVFLINQRGITAFTFDPDAKSQPREVDVTSRLAANPDGDSHVFEFDWRGGLPGAAAGVGLSAEVAPRSATFLADDGSTVRLDVRGDRLDLPDRTGRVSVVYGGAGTGGLVVDRHLVPRPFASRPPVAYRHEVLTASGTRVAAGLGDPAAAFFDLPSEVRVVHEGALANWCIAWAALSAVAGYAIRRLRRSFQALPPWSVAVTGAFAAPAVAWSFGATVGLQTAAAILFGLICGVWISDLDRSYGRRKSSRRRPVDLPSTLITRGLPALFIAAWIGPADSVIADDPPPDRRSAADEVFGPVIYESVTYEIQSLPQGVFEVDATVVVTVPPARPAGRIALPFEGLTLRADRAAEFDGRPIRLPAAVGGYSLSPPPATDAENDVATSAEIRLPMIASARTPREPGGVRALEFRGPPAASVRVLLRGADESWTYGRGAVPAGSVFGDETAADGLLSFRWDPQQPVTIFLDPPPDSESDGDSSVRCAMTVSPVSVEASYSLRLQEEPVKKTASPQSRWVAEFGVPAGVALVTTRGIDDADFAVRPSVDGTTERVVIDRPAYTGPAEFDFVWQSAEQPGVAGTYSLSFPIAGPLDLLSLRPASGFRFVGAPLVDGGTTLGAVPTSGRDADEVVFEVGESSEVFVTLAENGPTETRSSAVRQEVRFTGDRPTFECSLRVSDRGTRNSPLLASWRVDDGLTV
ncbi:MAG: hypothetical protein AAGJ97_09785, partial [Planctomycetota bacterium]